MCLKTHKVVGHNYPSIHLASHISKAHELELLDEGFRFTFKKSGSTLLFCCSSLALEVLNHRHGMGWINLRCRTDE